jgi:hypothetical protein
MNDIVFSSQAVLDAARKATGLDDFGDDDFREGLDILLETYDKTGELTPQGRKTCYGRVVGLLSSRLRVQDALKRHPEIREREIRRPIYLTGLPRTGTSALFNLLGADPAARPLYLWEAMCPDPLEDLEPGAEDPRFLGLKATFAKQREEGNEFSKIHHIDADVPEECVLLLAQTFAHVHNGIEVLMEPYMSWWLQKDQRAAFRYYRDMLKMLDWQRPGERWLLKSPAHMFTLDITGELFPDCCVVVTHRNPLEAVASYCSMMETLFRIGGYAPREGLGETVLHWLAVGIERLTEARKANPERFFDVRFEDFVSNNIGVIDKIYGHFDLPLDTAARAAMEAHVAGHPQGKHGSHEYGLESYGLSADRVKDRLADYIAEFDLPVD